MGFLRFRRSFKVIPGIRLILSKGGVSTSVGRRGALLTFGPRGTRMTVGMPGAGASGFARPASAAKRNTRLFPLPAPPRMRL